MYRYRPRTLDNATIAHQHFPLILSWYLAIALSPFVGALPAGPFFGQYLEGNVARFWSWIHRCEYL